MDNFELFDFYYPIVDERWRDELQQRIIDHYYYYEIGSETPDRFKHTLMSRLNLIMPYYNDLYMTQLLSIDPLLSTHIVETLEDKTLTSDKRSIEVEDGSITTSEGEYSSDEVFTEYPQSSTIEEDIPTNRTGIKGDNTAGTTVSSDSKTDLEGNLDTKRDYEKIIKGFSGDQGELIRSYRKNIININKMIINDLKTLFILVY